MMDRKQTVKRFLILFAAVVCFGALIVGYAYYAVATGDSFAAFKDWCAQSEKLALVVGQYKSVELVFLGASASEKDKGDTGSAAFRARIVGSKTTVEAEVAMDRRGDRWTVGQVLISGQQLDGK